MPGQCTYRIWFDRSFQHFDHFRFVANEGPDRICPTRGQTEHLFVQMQCILEISEIISRDTFGVNRTAFRRLRPKLLS